MGFDLTSDTRRWLISLLVLIATAAHGQTDDPQQLAAVVRVQLQAGNPDAAVETLARVEKARGARAPDYDWLFLQGVTWQEVAARGKSVEREQAIERAKQAYMQAIGLRSQAPAVFNNLGSLYAASGDSQSAEQWYRKAAESGSARRGYYALNYARAVEARDPKEALRYAQVTLKDSPDNNDVRSYVGALTRRVGSTDEFLQFLAESANRGHTNLVVALALEDLTAPTLRAPPADGSVLALLAFALSRDPTNLAQPPAADLVAALGRVSNADVRGGAQQLARALASPTPAGLELHWWRSQERIRPLNRSRASAMRELLLAIGQQRVEAPQDGERLFMSAIELGDQGPDPDAFLRLVELYANREQVSRLQELMRRYEVELFSEKGEAYRRNDMQLVYRMHLALGMTYAYMNVWSSPSPFQNATFQLENARRAADRFNEEAKRTGKPDRLVMPPAAVLKLADSYSMGGQKDRATQLRIASADALMAARRPADGAEVFKTIPTADVARLSDADRAKYRALGAAIK
jgi:tetratricopeptide (TPR) repeat protein